jgi:hypothetical protein
MTHLRYEEPLMGETTKTSQPTSAGGEDRGDHVQPPRGIGPMYGPGAGRRRPAGVRSVSLGAVHSYPHSR